MMRHHANPWSDPALGTVLAAARKSPRLIVPEPYGGVRRLDRVKRPGKCSTPVLSGERVVSQTASIAGRTG